VIEPQRHFLTLLADFYHSEKSGNEESNALRCLKLCFTSQKAMLYEEEGIPKWWLTFSKP
jgi:hypothetical protein